MLYLCCLLPPKVVVCVVWIFFFINVCKLVALLAQFVKKTTSGVTYRTVGRPVRLMVSTADKPVNAVLL